MRHSMVISSPVCISRSTRISVRISQFDNPRVRNIVLGLHEWFAKRLPFHTWDASIACEPASNMESARISWKSRWASQISASVYEIVIYTFLSALAYNVTCSDNLIRKKQSQPMRHRPTSATALWFQMISTSLHTDSLHLRLSIRFHHHHQSLQRIQSSTRYPS